jgi:hypothetical protein
MRGESSSGDSQAIILADQNFPVLLPVSSSDQCIEIVRVENGALLDLANVLVNMVRNRRIPVGSVVLLLSAFHPADVGGFRVH